MVFRAGQRRRLALQAIARLGAGAGPALPDLSLRLVGEPDPESRRLLAEILGNSENTLRLHYDGRTDVGKRRAIQALEL